MTNISQGSVHSTGKVGFVLASRAMLKGLKYARYVDRSVHVCAVRSDGGGGNSQLSAYVAGVIKAKVPGKVTRTYEMVYSRQRSRIPLHDRRHMS